MKYRLEEKKNGKGVEGGRRGDISVFRQLSSSVTCVRGQGERRGGGRGREEGERGGGVSYCTSRRRLHMFYEA
jgi:hypothetical protein